MRKLSPTSLDWPLAALAWQRTRGRWTWIVAVLLTVVAAGTVAAVGARLASSTEATAHEALRQLLLLNTRAVLWGPGFFAVVAGTLHAWKRDREDGILHLSVASGHGAVAYLRARTVVMAAWLFGMWLAGTALVVLVVLGANPSAARHGFLSSLGPSLAFATGACALLAVLGSVCLGPRSRPGGYLLLALLLFVPEAFSEWTRPLVGKDFVSLPALLGGIANAVRPGNLDAARLLTCSVVLACVLALLLAWLRHASSSWARDAALPGATG